MDPIYPSTELAKPFLEIFVDRAEAEWAFNLLRQTVERLGVRDPYDPRFALTMPHRSGRHQLRLNFGGWLVLGFRYQKNLAYRINMALIADRVNLGHQFAASPFAQSGNEPYVYNYELPIEMVKAMPDELRQAYDVTLDYIGWKFGHWKRSPYWKQHKPEVMEAVLSADKREQLFSQGLAEVPPALREAPEPYLWQDRAMAYSLAQCARETGLDEALLARWVQAIERKGQVILYGPPGTGKTYVAERLAEHLTGGGDGFWELVQFHPAYTYEDFVQGLRPRNRPEGGLDYPLVPGRFLEFCEKAQTCQDRCVLIIDEINRADLAQVLGELMYLLEYRDREINLAGGATFRVPANVRLIGTMNTADRSVALVDHALRRRFAFLSLYPNYEVLRRFHAKTGFPVERLIETLQRLNRQIGDRHYEVGITFFLHWNLAEQLEDIWRMEIEPYLEEYFFDQPEKVAAFRWETIKDQVGL